MWRPVLGLIGLVFVISITPAYGQAPPQNCFEDANDLCGLASGDPAQVFSAILVPLESQAVGFGIVIFWGGILAIVWFKTEDIKILGVVGIIVSATITGLPSDAQGIGMLLLAVSVGILLFQLIRQRVSIFS